MQNKRSIRTTSLCSYKKHLCVVLSAATILLCLSGCGCQHEWKDATCTEPKICTKCGEEEGAPLGHVTAGNACTGTDKCSICGAVVPAAGHIWTDATCTQPKTCQRCGAVEGEPLGHSYVNGACSRCGEVTWSPLEQSGTGDKTVKDITIGAGFYTAHFTNTKGKFEVSMKDAAGGTATLLSKSGSYDGTVLFYGASPVTFTITSGGEWTYKIDKAVQADKADFSGEGDSVTAEVPCKSGNYHITHSGKGEFYVHAFSMAGAQQIVATKGSYDQTIHLDLLDMGTLLFEVRADGPWSIQAVS